MNILKLNRAELRVWLKENYKTQNEYYVLVDRGNHVDSILSYLDALEEALCYGYIDSTVRPYKDGLCVQRFSKRSQKSEWTELNKARAERLIKKKLMRKPGLDAYKLAKDFYIDNEIQEAFNKNKKAYTNFKKFPALYQRVRIDTIQRYKKNRKQFDDRLAKLIENSEANKMYGQWNDNGRLGEENE